MTLKGVEALALKLPVAARGKLAAKLLNTLDLEDVADNERVWIEEADRRYKAYREGKTPVTNAKQAIAAARIALRS